MKNTVIRIAAVLVILSYFSSCYSHIKTDREYYGHKRYRRAGNYW